MCFTPCKVSVMVKFWVQQQQKLGPSVFYGIDWWTWRTIRFGGLIMIYQVREILKAGEKSKELESCTVWSSAMRFFFFCL